MGEFREDLTDAVKFHLFCFQCTKYPQSQKTVKLAEEGCLKSLALPEKSLEKQKNCW